MEDEAKDEPRTPDLPEAEEPSNEPAPRRLVMSREVRGWIAGLSALAVALAAVAPAVDFSDLTGSVTGTQVLSVTGNGDEASCTDEDQSSGVNGQSLSCDFSCPAEPGKMYVKVDADDSDAQVSATASCGNTSVHCSGKNLCEKNDVRTSSGDAACEADSDEAIDSGLYVECSATIEASTGQLPGPGTGDEFCPVTEPTTVCLQPACHQLKSTLQTQCQQVWDRLRNALTRDSVAAAFTTDGETGAGLVCFGYVCTPVVPICIQRADLVFSCQV